MRTHNGRTHTALIAVAAILLSGCGGGGGGGGSSIPATPSPAPTTPSGPVGTMVTIPIHGMTPTAAAYQAGTTGTWTAITPSGSNLTFTLPNGTTAYSVAAVCPFNGTPPFNDRRGPAEEIIQATTADSPDILCEQPSTVSVATINATAFVQSNAYPNTDTVSVLQASPGNVFGSGFSGTAGQDVFGSPLWLPGNSDVGILVRNTTTFASVAARLVRNVSFTANGTQTFDPLTTADASTTTPLTFPAGGQSSLFFWAPAEGGSFEAGFASASGTGVPLIPNAGGNDYYFATMAGSNGGQFSFTLTASSNAATLMPAAIPSAPYTITGTQSGDLCSLNAAYTGFTTSGTAKFYEVDLYWPQTTQAVVAGAPVLNVLASPSYLGTSTTVTVPDLSKVAGMFPNPTGGVAVNALADAYSVTGTPVWDNMLFSNVFLFAAPANNTQAQIVQSNYFNYTAP